MNLLFQAIALAVPAFGLFSLLHAVRTAPEGHEDEAGFHPGANRPVVATVAPSSPSWHRPAA